MIWKSALVKGIDLGLVCGNGMFYWVNLNRIEYRGLNGFN